MIKIQGKEITTAISKKVTIVKTYKGEIERTQTGIVAGYPLSFMTVGVELVIVDTKQNIQNLQQIILGSDIIRLQCDHNGVDFLGDFSVTSQDVEDLPNKGETKSTFTITLVNDNEKITKPDGNMFSVAKGSTPVTYRDEAYFAQIMKSSSYANYNLDGMSLPNNSILVLGDVTLTPNA